MPCRICFSCKAQKKPRSNRCHYPIERALARKALQEGKKRFQKAQERRAQKEKASSSVGPIQRKMTRKNKNNKRNKHQEEEEEVDTEMLGDEED